MFNVTRSYYFDMDFLTIAIGVLTFTQLSFGQANNGPTFIIKTNLDNLQASDTSNSIKTNISNLCGNYIDLAADRFNQKKFSMFQSPNRFSDIFTQPAKSVLENHPNVIFSSILKQQTAQQLPNLSEPKTSIQQHNNFEPEKPNISLGCLNLLQNPNVNTIQTIPGNEPLPYSNFLPGPNIEYKPLQNTNNFGISAAMRNTASVTPSVTITTSLSPSFIPENVAPQVFMPKLSDDPDLSIVSPNKVFVALRETPKSQPTISTYAPNTENTGQNSLNLKTILPLILNLVTEKEGCTSCSRCNCCCNSNNSNVKEAPQIDSGYSRQRKYPFSSEELEENASEELKRILVKRIKNKIYEAKRKVKYQRNNVLSEDDGESQSDEDY